MRWLLPWVAVLCLSATASGQQAQDPSEIAKARQLFERGSHAYAEGRFREALALFKQADAKAPSAELAFNIARVAERMGEARVAIAHFERYLEQATPSDSERKTVSERIERLRRLGERQRAQALKEAPGRELLNEEARVFFERGLELYRRGKLKGALAALTAAQRFARAPEIDYNLAVVAERLKRFRDAVDYYRAYLRAKPRADDRAAIAAHIKVLRSR